jgi:tetraacyldisaccharide 4'-kinase
MLRLAAAGYRIAVTARNRSYRLGLCRGHRVPVPVISVGNITAGGTGKTPFVAWLARLMVIHKMRPVILSRGYGRHGELALDDENQMLARLAADIPVVVDPDRLRGTQVAVRVHGAELLILDDGFQHRRIARDLDIVLVDAVWPFGAGHLLPRGLLREPVSELARTDFLVLTRVGLVGTESCQATKKRLAELAPGVPTACCTNVVEGLRPLGGAARQPVEPERLRSGRWAAFCGIGNPEGFRLTLQKAGCELAFLRVFSDHERYRARQIEQVHSAAERAGCQGLITTEKDAVKVEGLLKGSWRVPFYALQTDLEFIEGSQALIAAILKAARGGE